MKNVYTVTWPLYRSWAMESSFRGVRLALAIAWFLLGAVTLLLFFSGSGILYLPIALFSFYRAFLRSLVLACNVYRTLVKTYGKTGWRRTVTFEDDGICLTEETCSARYSYGDLSGIREQGDRITLSFKNGTVLRLYRSAFVGTDWDACKAFIQERRSGCAQP